MRAYHIIELIIGVYLVIGFLTVMLPTIILAAKTHLWKAVIIAWPAWLIWPYSIFKLVRDARRMMRMMINSKKGNLPTGWDRKE